MTLFQLDIQIHSDFRCFSFIFTVFFEVIMASRLHKNNSYNNYNRHKVSYNSQSRSRNLNKNGNHDELCYICNEWMFNQNDFVNNFVKCINCPRSYHIQCIKHKVNINFNNLNSFECNLINESCNKSRNYMHSKLVQFTEQPYWSIFYHYNEQQQNKVFTNYYIDQSKQINHNHNHKKLRNHSPISFS